MIRLERTLAPEVRSQNTEYEVNRAYKLIRLPMQPRHEPSVSIRKKYPFEPRLFGVSIRII